MNNGQRPPVRFNGRMPRNMFTEKPKDSKNALKRLIKYLGSSKNLLITMIFVIIISTVASILSPVVQGYVLDAIDDRKEKLFIGLLVALAACYVINVAAIFLRSYIAAYLSKQVILKIRKDLFEELVYLPISFFDTHAHGDIMSRMTNDVDSISNTISTSVAALISTALTILGAVVVMLLFSPLLTLVALVSVILSIVFSRFMSKRMRKYFKKQQEILGELNAQVEESVTGQKTVSAYNKEKDFEQNFNKTSDELQTYAIKAQIYGGAMGPVMNIVGNIGFLLIVVFGALFKAWEIGAGLFGPISIGTIIIFTNCSKQINRPINEVAQLYVQIETSLAAAERVFEIMDAEEEIDEGTIVLPDDFEVTEISFEHVYFSYVKGELVLKDFNLTINSDQKIALVGATGSGKTTVVNLLMRFYEIDSGSIKINGIDIKDIKKSSLRQMISIVLQDTVLFTDTILNNLKYGKLDATMDEVEASSKLANSDKFIRHLPDGYNTHLANSAANLSQGQRQLLTIARAALPGPKILILDEATSSVDTRTEKNIQDAMVNLMKNRTSLIIAHRLSTIKDADKIVVMEQGTIKELGNHEELLEQKGIYYNLYQTQFAGNAI